MLELKRSHDQPLRNAMSEFGLLCCTFSKKYIKTLTTYMQAISHRAELQLFLSHLEVIYQLQNFISAVIYFIIPIWLCTILSAAPSSVPNCFSNSYPDKHPSLI